MVVYSTQMLSSEETYDVRGDPHFMQQLGVPKERRAEIPARAEQLASVRTSGAQLLHLRLKRCAFHRQACRSTARATKHPSASFTACKMCSRSVSSRVPCGRILRLSMIGLRHTRRRRRKGVVGIG